MSDGQQTFQHKNKLDPSARVVHSALLEAFGGYERLIPQAHQHRLCHTARREVGVVAYAGV